MAATDGNSVDDPMSDLSSEVLDDEALAMEKDMELMKEKFSKLLLGEDMSGGGKGVSSALALSNAITNLAASAFAEQRKLEPMPEEQKVRWRKELDWMLSVTDYIVEFAPSQQMNKDGSVMEIMTTKQRSDVQRNIPALKALDDLLLSCLDNFEGQHEFSYASKDADESEKGAKRKDDKWWLPTVKVPPNGLSEEAKMWLETQKDAISQVLKVAMGINAQIISEMEIPENYIESLPKNGRSSLGDSMYKSITDDTFDPEQFLSAVDLSSEHKIVDLKNRIEASICIWKRKMTDKTSSKSSWGASVSMEKRELFEDRAESILVLLKQRFPGISQSNLDISKIQYNKDVGKAVLESYSRVLESLAHKVISQIEDVMYADSLAQNPSLGPHKRVGFQGLGLKKIPGAGEGSEAGDRSSTTLLDFMSCPMDEGEAKGSDDGGQDVGKDGSRLRNKLKLDIPKKFNYIENLGGLRSPTARR